MSMSIFILHAVWQAVWWSYELANKETNKMTVMQRHPLEASDMAAGRAARAAGIACHYNPFDFYAEPQRYCAWKEGWRA